MNKYFFLIYFLLGQLLSVQAQSVEQVLPGVFKVSFGDPGKFTPEQFRTKGPKEEALKRMPEVKLPFDLSAIKIKVNGRGVIATIPLKNEEQLYGFGLQMGSFQQNNLRKRPIVNDYPLNNLGYSHAPLPYYVSNEGYAVLINTAKYATFYCGGNQPKGNLQFEQSNQKTMLSVDELYQSRGTASGNVIVDIPGAKGVEIYIFAGSDMLTAIQRYNLFAGGGTLPPLWGLGIKYRVMADFKESDVYKTAEYFRQKKIPVDVIGLEPRWQTSAYPCSFAWNTDFFPDPKAFTDKLKRQGYRVNLWEHAFVSSSSPLYSTLFEKSGDFLAFNGLVPDFIDQHTRALFGSYHKEHLIDVGVSGFKLDECDNSDLRFGSARWSFPEHTQFPSGIDGEQMHQLFGVLYQKAIYEVFKKMNKRTYLDVRSSGPFASPYPAALYSDTYDHKEYIEQIANAGFSGLLWSPEVRESQSFRELARRSQTAVLSAQTLFNSWYLQNPPWLQVDRGKNNRNELLPDAEQNEETIKQLLNFRMQLIPYLYAAFHKYETEGIPVFRALVMDYPKDPEVFDIANEYLIGAGLLAAPITGDSDSREIYLPAGNWYNFNSNQKYIGGKRYKVSFKLNEIPLFVKEGTILPLADALPFIDDDTTFNLTCYLYGAPSGPAYLFEDDGITYNYENKLFNTIKLTYADDEVKLERAGAFQPKRYHLGKTVHIP
ncbi:glycoside hydrolase family 31 protein [Olivibacter sp. CPCC 100613]|uniref:glycoside hydrolase family 31 protein n=1 Tax=Olivibacter sp. CPCC 100613 TaxID=3079931 RepID=UPI002FF5E21C